MIQLRWALATIMLLMGSARLTSQTAPSQQSIDLPKIPLRMGLYTDPQALNVEIEGTWFLETIPLGSLLDSVTEEMCTKVFASTHVLEHYPLPSDSSDLQGLDYILVLEQIHGEVRKAGFATNSQVINVEDTFAIYAPGGNRLYFTTEKEVVKVKLPVIAQADNANKKVNDATKEALTTTVRHFLSKFAKTELATKSPAPAESPRRLAGRLTISTQPTGAQVYLNDQLKGVTSEQEGKLLVGDLPVGTYALRIALVGHKDWVRAITVNSGDELKVEAKLVSAGPPPLSFKEIEEALTNGVPRGRVKALVDQYGVNFALSNEAEQRLRSVGADVELLLAISKNKK